MKQFFPNDTAFMHQALELAQRVKGTTFPNPAVGAVVVLSGTCVGTGATAQCGGPHAEIAALQAAGKKAAGATLYVTLEPCCHFGRTPPCTKAIIAAKIARVVVAMPDPNPRVNGCGLKALRRAGIKTAVGCLQAQAHEINEDFCFSILARRPWITLKLAMTLDGRIADARGNSRWISSPAARRHVHALRSLHAAVAVGKGTFAADNPRLTVRARGAACFKPARIVFAAPDAISLHSNLYKTAAKYRTICVSPAKGKSRIETGPGGLEIWHCAGKTRLQRMKVFLHTAYDQGLSSILVEGGSSLASFFLEHRLVNRAYLFWGNKIVGNGLPGIRFEKGLAINRSFTFANPQLQCFNDSGFMMTGLVQYQ